MLALVFSECTLRRNKHAWIRFWSYGPGIGVYRSCAEPFSVRTGNRKCWRIRSLTFVWMSRVKTFKEGSEEFERQVQPLLEHAYRQKLLKVFAARVKQLGE